MRYKEENGKRKSIGFRFFRLVFEIIAKITGLGTVVMGTGTWAVPQEPVPLTNGNIVKEYAMKQVFDDLKEAGFIKEED